MENYDKFVGVGWLLPKDIKDKFKNFCEKNGLVAQQNCAGALVIWMYLPAQIREQAILEAMGTPSVDKKFWDEYRSGLEQAIKDRLNNPPDKPRKK